ncbi:MAG: hypothetical protein FJ304_07510 [Planctomycetes bacterium]|nr:hypothetical protein [Planctomycetota bacterium]
MTPTEPAPKGFPFVTVFAAVGVLFVFLGLMWLATQKQNPLEQPKPETADTKAAEPKPDAAAKLDEVKARNAAALDGVGAQMSLAEAHGKLMGTLKGPNDKLPFPKPEAPVKK